MARFSYLFLVFILTVLVFTASAFAITLDVAKSQGLVGEKPDGYLGARTHSEEISQLVTEINDKRKVSYEEIARNNRTSVAAVEALAGKKAIEKTSAGQYVQDSNGNWVKK